LKTAVDENVSSQLLLTLAGASAVAILFSIAVAQILLGLGLLVLLLQPRSWRLPPVMLPLGLFVLWTVISKTVAQGLLTPSAQLRKFFVYLLLILIYAAVRRAVEARWILLAICAAGILSASWSMVQFVRKFEASVAAEANFYLFYVGGRTTGFMSHWMTFSAEMLVVLTISLAFLLFGVRDRRLLALAAIAASLSAVALVLNLTRSAWIAAFAALIYLIAVWKPKWLLVVPLLAAIGYAVSPRPIQMRVLSILYPHGETDSNRHRYVTWRTGLAMVQASPLLGLGPEMVEKRFPEFIPEDVARPLPDGWYGHLHNLYLQIAAERGLPALAILLWLLGTFVRDWMRGLRLAKPGRSDERFTLQAAMAVMVGVLVNGFFEYNLGNSEPLHLFLALSGCAYAVYASLASSSLVPSQRPTV
jgi:putative inorganic carbon (HCO3(-)) transporter